MGTEIVTYNDFQIDRTDLHRTRVITTSRVPLEPGQVRFQVDEFALTANNITYAALGTALGYLDFFPTGDDTWRRIPVMGHGDLIESAHPDIEAGGRYFGFFPMAGEHVLTASARGANVWDAGEHRAPHAATYRQFERVDGRPSHSPAREPHVALLRGLFITSFLIDDFLADSNDYGATSVLVTSASSKTSIALGHCLGRRGVPTVGITSARHLAAVGALGCYDRVITYDDITGLDPSVPTVVVDMAGDGTVIHTIHTHFGDRLAYSCVVGGTHWDAARRSGPLPGPVPQFFFAPGQIEKRTKDWGPGEVMRRAGEAFATFSDFADSWLEISRGHGPAAVETAYRAVLDGASAPTTGVILSLHDS